MTANRIPGSRPAEHRLRGISSRRRQPSGHRYQLVINGFLPTLPNGACLHWLAGYDSRTTRRWRIGERRCPRYRHRPPAPGPDVRLSHRRQEPFRGRQGNRRRRPRLLARGTDRAAGKPPLPRPGSALPGRRGRHPAVPRRWHRPAVHGQRARNRAAGRSRDPGRLCRQRPAGAGARAGAAHLGPGRADRLHPGRLARPGRDPVVAAGPVGDRLQPAGGAAAGRGAALPRRRGQARRGRRGPAGGAAAGIVPGGVAPDGGARPRRGRRRAAGLPGRGHPPARARRGRVRGARVRRARPGTARGGAGVRVATGRRHAAARPGRGVVVRRGGAQAPIVTRRGCGASRCRRPAARGWGPAR